VVEGGRALLQVDTSLQRADALTKGMSPGEMQKACQLLGMFMPSEKPSDTFLNMTVFLKEDKDLPRV
jgi:hypothetical protein